MKKTLGIILSLALCVSMLAGCSKSGNTEETTTAGETTSAAETTEETEAEAKTEAETEAAAGEAVASGATSGFAEAYANLGEGKEINAKDSNTYKFMQELNGAKSLYISFTMMAPEGESALEMAIEGENVYMKTESPEASGIIYIVDMAYTMYDPSTMTAMTMKLDQETYDSMDLKNAFSSFELDDDFDDVDGKIMSHDVEVEGKKYTYEVDDAKTCYYVYDENGKIVTFAATDSETAMDVIINAFTTEVPAEVWTQPTGYTVQDLSAALSAAE